MKLNKTDKKIILQYLNEGIALRKNMREDNQRRYSIEDSAIIHLLKALGFKLVFENEKYVSIDETPETRRSPIPLRGDLR